ncbi:MAG: glycan-binding surface protein [Cyclobacteriaceae bacterium]
MKIFNRISQYLLFVTFGAIVFTSCMEDDSTMSGGEPSISYIRITDPESSDSLLIAAGQGSMIAIIGENLQQVRQIWFNDRQAQLSPNLITATSVITRVPSLIPVSITNQLKLVFPGRDTLFYDFRVAIGEPQITSMVSEYVNAGGIARIRGQYFYEPLTVTFPGGVTGEVVDVEDEMIEVIVPEGAQSGPITVTNNFGESESDFWFRDNRNIIGGFEGTEDADFSGWWYGKDFIVSSDPDIPAINNQFIRINRELAEWGWFEMWVGNGGTILEETSNIPADAFDNPDKYSLKFEINTLESLTGARIHMYMGPDMPGERGTNYMWEPNLHTEGQWETVSIPWNTFLAASPTLDYNPNGYQISFHFSGPLAVNAQFGLDNVRVVPN